MESCSFRHLTMPQLKIENVILIWEARTNIRAVQTSLAVQEVNFSLQNPKHTIICNT